MLHLVGCVKNLIDRPFVGHLHFFLFMWYFPHGCVLLSWVVPFQWVQCVKLCSVFFFFFFSLSCTSLFILLSLYLFSFSMLFCSRELSGCAAKPNSLSYNSPHDVSYNSGCAVSSIYSPWICGKDCDVSEVSWLDSLRFLPFYSFFPYEFFLAFGLSLGA